VNLTPAAAVPEKTDVSAVDVAARLLRPDPDEDSAEADDGRTRPYRFPRYSR
jgi:hypothetical protein